MRSTNLLMAFAPAMLIYTTATLATPLPAQDEKRPAQSSRGTLKFTYSPNITRVTFNHPPLNIFDETLGGDLLEFLQSIQYKSGSNNPAPPKIVIFDSADPEVFASHIDLNYLFRPDGGSSLFNILNTVMAYLRNTTTSAFISEINGLATGFGNEFLLQTDMRYAGPKARSSQLENSGGVITGAGGQQALTRLINRGRGLQYLLSSEAVNGSKGAELGWFNEYYPDAKQLKGAVNAIAKRIALFPAGALNATKAGLVELYPPQYVYERDQASIVRLFGAPGGLDPLRKALQLGNNQSRGDFELGLPDTFLQLYE